MSKASKTKSTKSDNKAKTTEDHETVNSQMDQQAKIYRYKDIDFANVEVSELKTDTDTQPLAYIRYNDTTLNTQTRLLLQTGRIKLTSGGIPKQGKFYETDDKREFIKTPLDPEQPACVELKNHLEKADKFFGSSEMKKKLFGKHADKYQYSPCIKEVVEKEEDSEDENPKKKQDLNKKEYPRHDSCKMKLTIVVDGEGRTNRTKLLRYNAGKKPTPVTAHTLADVCNHITFLSEVKYIFHYSKVWANKSPSAGSKFKLYGVGFKLVVIEFSPSVNKGGPSMNNIEFLSSEEDDDAPTKKSSNAKLDDSDSDDGKKVQANAADSESEEELKPKKGLKPKAKVVDSDEESEELKPKKGLKPKAKVDDSESEEEIKPKKGTKPKAKVVDSDEESEEIKPKKNTKAKNSK